MDKCRTKQLRRSDVSGRPDGESSLVTGRRLAELLEVLPQIDLFDCVVAENGAVLDVLRQGRQCCFAGRCPLRLSSVFEALA